MNYHSTSDFENAELSIRIARSDQWEQANRIIEEVLHHFTDGFSKQAQRQTDHRMRGFYFSHVSPSWRIYLSLTPDREVEFAVCFPAPIGQRRAVATQITKEIMKQFAEAGIDMTPRD